MIPVNVTVIETVTASSKTLQIQAIPEPIDLTGQGQGAIVIQWRIDQGSPWSFVMPPPPNTKGIEIKNPGSAFSDPGGGGQKVWTWTRNAGQANGATYPYTIRVTDNTSTVCWDPTIINRP